jgi:hypothetical protein
VVQIKGADIFINAGSQQGMAPDSLLAVQSVRGLIRDPESHTILGEDLHGIGTLKVIAVQPGFSIARIHEGCKKLKRGDRVELATEPVPPQRLPACPGQKRGHLEWEGNSSPRLHCKINIY